MPTKKLSQDEAELVEAYRNGEYSQILSQISDDLAEDESDQSDESDED